MANIACPHEDDYCQVEVLPAANWEHCARQIGKIEEFSAAHRAPEGAGWTSAYVRPSEPLGLDSVQLLAPAVGEIFRKHLPEFDSVQTGYGAYAEAAPRTRAFGQDSDGAAYFDFRDDGVVEHLWVTVVALEPETAPPMIEAIVELGRMAPLLLVDWSFGSLFLLEDRAAIEAYFRR